jgi:hypothetical protein
VEQLAGFWHRDLGEPRRLKWESLPGTGMREALQLGIWRLDAYTDDGKAQPRFNWIFPNVVRYASGGGANGAAFVAEVANNPKASFLDLMRAAALSDETAFDKRALKLAMPELDKLPVGIRDGVIEVLTKELVADDIGDLPKLAAEKLGKRLDVQRGARLKEARQSLERMKTTGAMAMHAGEAGRVVGKVVADDPKLAEEILSLWRSAQPKKQGDQDFNGFMNGLFADCAKDIDAVFSRLVMMDRLWQGGPPGWSSNGNDPFVTAWGLMAWGRPPEAKVWRRFAELSPRMQVRLVLGARAHFLTERSGNAEWQKESRLAAKDVPLTRHACEWFLVMQDLGNHPKQRCDGAAPLALLETLKAAGATPEELANVVADVFKVLPQLDNAAEIMKRTPELLAGFTTVPQNLAGQIIEGVFRLWGRVQMEMQEAGKVAGEARERIPVHPAETTALFKFIMAKLPGGKLERYFSSGQVTSVLLALDDEELLDRWVAVSRDRFIGDALLVRHFLRNDRLEEALALLPQPGKGGLTSYSSVPFSQETEELAGKLAAVDTIDAFRLRVLMSMHYDARDAGKPSEARGERLKRLAGEFEQRRASLSRLERMAMCQDLELTGRASHEHVPALDEFAGEEAAKVLRDRFSGQSPRGDGLSANLAMAAVQSRFHAGDPSGLESLAEAVRQAPDGEQIDQLVKQSLIPISSCFWQYADRRSGNLPEAAAAAIRTFATAIATRKDPAILAEASLLVHLAASDEASLKAGVEAAGLVGVAPARFTDPRYGVRSHYDPALQTMLRVSLLHPCSAELLRVLERPSAMMSQMGTFLSLLEDPKVRARLAPAMFLDWTRYTTRVAPPHMAGLKAYATERRADFDEAQRVKLDALIKRVENPRQEIDPELRDQMQREQMEEMEAMRRAHDDLMRRGQGGQRRFNR